MGNRRNNTFRLSKIKQYAWVVLSSAHPFILKEVSKSILSNEM